MFVKEHTDLLTLSDTGRCGRLGSLGHARFPSKECIVFLQKDGC